MGKLLVTASATAMVVGLIAGLSAPAHAQAQYNWSGWYLGANFGGGWGPDTTDVAPNNDPTSVAFWGPAFTAGAVPKQMKIGQDGFIGGVQARYNWQFGSVVMGPDFDINGSSISGKKTINTNVTPGFTPGSFSAEQSLDFLSTLRGQIGFTPINRLLLFANVGLAVGHVNYKYNLSFPSTSDFHSNSTSHMNFGGTIGTGFEYAFTDNLTVRGEYMFVDLGSQSTFAPATAAARAADRATQIALSNENKYHIFRVGLTYHFAPPPPPPPAMAPAAVPARPAAPAPAAASSRQEFIVFFEFDKSTLTTDGAKVVEAAAAAYKKGGSAKIAVAGYTDRAGTATYNMALSQRRARTVSTALVRNGVPENQIGVSAFGEEHPRVPTPDGVREPQNRRVEIDF